MPAQKTIACPHCGTQRVTKATGRQRLACASSSCGRSFLVRDAQPVEIPPPAPAPAGEPPARTAPPAAPAAAQVPASAAGPSQAGGIAGIEVLEPATLRLTKPVLAPPLESGENPVADPTAGPSEEDQAERVPAGPDPAERVAAGPGAGAPVVAGPGRRIGYYGRVTGRG